MKTYKRAIKIVRKSQLIEPLGSLQIKNPKYEQLKRFSRYPVKEPKLLKFYSEDGDLVAIPRNFPTKGKVAIRTNEGDKISFTHSINWREEQEEFLKEWEYYKNRGVTDFIFNVDTGKGKTLLTIGLAKEYGKKTLIVVDKNPLGKQFIQKIKQFTDATAGFIKDGIFDFTVTTYQFLSGAQSKDYTNAKQDSFYEPFGHIVYDEYHKAGAERFSIINTIAPCKYRTGLTATLRRKDKTEKILIYHCGKVLKMKEKKKNVFVHPVEYDLKKSYNHFTGYQQRAVNQRMIRNGETVKVVGKETKEGIYQDGMLISKGKVIDISGYKLYPKSSFSVPVFETYIAENKEFQDDLAKFVSKVNTGNVLLLSSRKVLLFALHEKLKKYGIKAAILMSTSNQDFKKFCGKEGKSMEEMYNFAREKAEVVLAINSIGQEGMDIERLDTLILTNYIRDIEQALGRITREYKGKINKYVYPFIYKGLMEHLFYGSKSKKGAAEMFTELGCDLYPPKNIRNYL